MQPTARPCANTFNRWAATTALGAPPSGTLFFRAMRDTLTERQYQALCMHYLDGKSQKQIAALWGVSPSAVCRHLKKARRRLAIMLSYNLEFQAH